MRMKKNICAILACAMIFGAFSIPVAEAKEAPVMQIMEMRATGEFSFDIPAKTLMKASSGFPMEYGETVKITASYSPASASVDFGLIDSDGIAGNSTVDGIRLSDENLNEEETALKESFLTSINTPSQADEVIADEENMVVERASTSTNSLNPNCIGGIYYNNVVSRPSDLEINRAIKWQTSLSGLSPNTNYVVELWVRHVGSTTNNKKGSVSVRTNSNGKASVSQQVTFSSPGEIETTIKVYKGSTLVAERTGGSPDMVYARWSINLALNSNHLGTLYFYYASGAQAHHCDAKGKSGKGYTWDKEYGHTPPGDYYGETGGPSKDTEKYGPNKFIRMKGNQDPGYENLYVDGDYVTRGRSGLLIHGGRDQTSLWNTEGCVRIFDKDAKKITGLMDSWRSAGYHQFGRIKITRPGQSL